MNCQWFYLLISIHKIIMTIYVLYTLSMIKYNADQSYTVLCSTQATETYDIIVLFFILKCEEGSFLKFHVRLRWQYYRALELFGKCTLYNVHVHCIYMIFIIKKNVFLARIRTGNFISWINKYLSLNDNYNVVGFGLQEYLNICLPIHSIFEWAFIYQLQSFWTKVYTRLQFLN